MDWVIREAKISKCQIMLIVSLGFLNRKNEERGREELHKCVPALHHFQLLNHHFSHFSSQKWEVGPHRAAVGFGYQKFIHHMGCSWLVYRVAGPGLSQGRLGLSTSSSPSFSFSQNILIWLKSDQWVI